MTMSVDTTKSKEAKPVSLEINARDPEVLRDIAIEARQVYEAWPGIDEREDFADHARKVSKYVKATAGELVPIEVYTIAAELHDLTDRNDKGSMKWTPEREIAVAHAMMELFSDPRMTYDQGAYLLPILADMRATERASGNYRKSMAAQTRNGSGVVSREVMEMVSRRYEGSVPPEAFNKIQPMIDFEHMGQFLEDINIESFIVKANELYVNMREPSSRRKSALLQDILEAESFYAPIAEALGMEGLAAMLRSQANRIRLMEQGLAHNVGRAEAKMDPLYRLGAERAMRVVFGDSYNFTSSHVVGKVNGEHPVHIGEFVAAGGEVSFAGNWRFKTPGGLAAKLEKKKASEISGLQPEVDMPMDLFGMMIIADDDEAMANSFVHFLKTRQHEVQLQPGRSKKKAIIVQGSRKYAALVASKLREAGISDDLVQYKTQSKKEANVKGYKQYEVSKVTFIAHDKLTGVDIPTEVQFVTKAERERSRLGETAHVIYKYLKQLPEKPTNKEEREIVRSAVRVLRAMYARKANLNPESFAVNKRTVERGDKMFKEMFDTYEAYALTA